MPSHPFRITETTRRNIEEAVGEKFYEDPPGSGLWAFPQMPIKVEIWPDSMATVTESGEAVVQMGGMRKLSPEATEFDCDGGCGTKIWLSEPLRGAKKFCPNCATDAMMEDDDLLP